MQASRESIDARRTPQAGVGRSREPERWLEPDRPQPFGRAAEQPRGDSLIARVVDDERLEVGLAVREHRKQPALRVGLPAVNHREQGDGAWSGGRSVAGGRLQRHELAPVVAVLDVPPAFAQSLADRVGLHEVLFSPAPSALGCQLLRFLLG